MPPKELLDAAKAIPQLDQYRQRIDDLNRLLAPRIFFETTFRGLPNAAVTGLDDFQRHVTMISTLLSAQRQQKAPRSIRAKVVLTTEKVEVGISPVRFEFTRDAVALYWKSQLIDTGLSLEEIFARHLNFSQIPQHLQGLHLANLFISRPDERAGRIVSPLAAPVALQDWGTVVARMKNDPDRWRVEAAQTLRDHYNRTVSATEQFDRRELDRLRFDPSVREAAKLFGTFRSASGP
jgi:hypothetical protein